MQRCLRATVWMLQNDTVPIVNSIRIPGRHVQGATDFGSGTYDPDIRALL